MYTASLRYSVTLEPAPASKVGANPILAHQFGHRFDQFDTLPLHITLVCTAYECPECSVPLQPARSAQLEVQLRVTGKGKGRGNSPLSVYRECVADHNINLSCMSLTVAGYLQPHCATVPHSSSVLLARSGWQDQADNLAELRPLWQLPHKLQLNNRLPTAVSMLMCSRH